MEAEGMKKEIKDLKKRVKELERTLSDYAEKIRDLWNDWEVRLRFTTDEVAERERMKGKMDLLMKWMGQLEAKTKEQKEYRNEGHQQEDRRIKEAAGRQTEESREKSGVTRMVTGGEMSTGASNWMEIDLGTLEEEKVVKERTVMIKRGRNLQKEHRIQEFIEATVGEFVDWKLYAVEGQVNMVYLVLDNAETRKYMTDKKEKVGRSKILTIDEIRVYSKTERYERSKRWHKALKLGYVSRMNGDRATIRGQEYVWDPELDEYRKEEEERREEAEERVD